MEPFQPNSNTGNWNQPMNQGKELSGAIASMVLGIVALVFVTLGNCCYFLGSFISIVLSIIGLVLGAKATKLYDADPNQYNVKSLKLAKAGKIMNLIALILSVLFLIVFAVMVIMIGSNMSDYDSYRSFDSFD